MLLILFDVFWFIAFGIHHETFIFFFKEKNEKIIFELDFVHPEMFILLFLSSFHSIIQKEVFSNDNKKKFEFDERF